MDNLHPHCCVQCGKCFSNASNLHRHERLAHSASTSSVNRKSVKCVLCDGEFLSKKTFDEHLIYVHDFSFEKEFNEFASKEEFLEWKKNIEKENVCCYVKNRGSKQYRDVIHHYYYCHRSGFFSSRSEGKRNVKILGSNKMDVMCPSMIKVKEKGNNFKVEYLKTHIGHRNMIWEGYKFLKQRKRK